MRSRRGDCHVDPAERPHLQQQGDKHDNHRQHQCCQNKVEQEFAAPEAELGERIADQGAKEEFKPTLEHDHDYGVHEARQERHIRQHVDIALKRHGSRIEYEWLGGNVGSSSASSRATMP